MSLQPIRKDEMRCPYDASHVLKKDKFLNHIEKCKIKNGKFSSVVQCRYNPWHF